MQSCRRPVFRYLGYLPLFFFAAFVWLAGVSLAQAAELTTKDIVQGDGPAAALGAKVTVHYTGWVVDGERFDSSRDRNQPLVVVLGQGRLIPGWEKGVMGMKPGGKRELLIPPHLAYGAQGAGDVIPPNATLRFEVEVLDVQPLKYSNIGNEQLKDMLDRGVKVVDIRRPDEWRKTGVVEGSKLLTFFDDQGRVNPGFSKAFGDYVSKEEEVILICRTGNRTQAVSNFLSEKMGFSQIHNVTDGITHWIKEGLPVVDAKPPKDCWLCR